MGGYSNSIKFETGQKLPPVLKIVTCHVCRHKPLLLQHMTRCSIFSMVQSFVPDYGTLIKAAHSYVLLQQIIGTLENLYGL